MSNAISNRQPSVYVQYTTLDGTLHSKFFPSAIQAKSFYVSKLKAGHNPKVLRSETMTTETTTNTTTTKTKTAKKVAPKKVAKKAPAKKTAKKTPVKKKVGKSGAKATAKKEGKRRTPAGQKPDYLRKPQILVLEILANGRSQSKSQISEALETAVNLSEHLGRTDGGEGKYTKSLLEWGYVKATKEDVDNKDTILFTITASGKKALTAAAK